MAKLIAGGDSFVYGSELKGPAFPELVARELSWEYQNTAVAGHSNGGISRHIINACAESDSDLVIVCWTFLGRYEFYINGKFRTVTPWSVDENLEQTITEQFVNEDDSVRSHHIKQHREAQESGLHEFAQSYYRYVGDSEYTEVYNTLLHIVRTQQYLKAHNRKYVFTAVHENVLGHATKHLDDPSIRSLYKEVDLNHWFWFPKQLGFYTWAQDRKFPFATTHPLDPAHQEASKLLHQKILTSSFG